LKATPTRVWRALTTHAEFGQWFGVKLEEPFVVGQVAAGHMTHPGYEQIRWAATVQKMEPERLFSFTWHPYAIDPKQDYSGETPTLVEFRLKPVKGGTQFTVTETGFEQVPAARRAEAFRMHEQGWTAQMENIERHLASLQGRIS
jgi:uncharacterized protein YndB with AHSA1/START domain